MRFRPPVCEQIMIKMSQGHQPENIPFQSLALQGLVPRGGLAQCRRFLMLQSAEKPQGQPDTTPTQLICLLNIAVEI
jgi:hypothetical protein